MEVYAGFLEHTDHHIGRLIAALEDLEILDDTLVYYVIGDNGASAEGTPTGCFNELVVLNGAAGLETTEFMVSRIDDFGTPAAYNHYAVVWAHAMDTPYQWTKQVASHWGGTRNGTIVHWPNGMKAKGEIRSQFHHVIDVAPTVLEAAGLPEPRIVHGVEQRPIEGVSMRYAFDDPDAAERRERQYFEMFCNRGIYDRGWTGVTRHSTPWVMADLPPLADDTWELYDTNTDWSQAHDLAAEMPEKLEEGQLAAPLRRHGPAERELGGQRQEQVALRHGRGRDPGGWRRRRHRGAGRRLCGLEPVRQGPAPEVLSQPLRAPAVPRRG
jgi:arylsulfatase